MLVDLIKNRMIQKKSLLLCYYKVVGLTENQVLIVLLIMQLSNDDRKFVTARELSQYMTITTTKIDEEISSLVKLKFIKIENKSGKTVINLSPLFSQLAIVCENSFADTDGEANLFQLIDDQFKEPLNEQQSKALKGMIDKEISIQTLTELIITNKVNDYDSLVKLVKENIKSKPKELTKYNWLVD